MQQVKCRQGRQAWHEAAVGVLPPKVPAQPPRQACWGAVAPQPPAPASPGRASMQMFSGEQFMKQCLLHHSRQPSLHRTFFAVLPASPAACLAAWLAARSPLSSRSLRRCCRANSSSFCRASLAMRLSCLRASSGEKLGLPAAALTAGARRRRCAARNAAGCWEGPGRLHPAARHPP